MKKQTVAKKIATSPLRVYNGYSVKRVNGNVVFGCGSVTIPIASLLVMADIVENEELKVDFKYINSIRSGAYIYFENVNGKTNIQGIKDFLKVSKKYPKELDIVNNINAILSGRSSIRNKLFDIPAITYRRLAGVKITL